MPETATTAAEALDRYEAFLSHDAIVQRMWHGSGANGRKLACGLGVIGPAVFSPRDCPAAIMPRWLAQMVPWLFDGQSKADALAWGSRFYSELARLNGSVPFSVIHDWQSNIVGPLAIEVSTKRCRKVETHEALKAMHADALAGKSFTADEWRPVLKAAFFDADAYADAYANANADAYADAYANAYANADANADANAYADADADANADAYAYANANAYANAYANANANAYADADANADAYAYANANAKKQAVKRLADGLVDCMARVTTEAA